jgi:hypothetical protein
VKTFKYNKKIREESSHILETKNMTPISQAEAWGAKNYLINA